MNRSLFLAFFLTCPTILLSQQDGKLRVGTAFKDISEISGYENKASTAVNLHYGVNHIKSYNNDHYLVSSKFEDGEMRTNDYQMRVVNVVELPPYREEYFTVKLKNCYLNGRADASLFALVVDEQKRQLKNILKVWKLDRRTGIITSAQTKGVSCYNENWVAYSEN